MELSEDKGHGKPSADLEEAQIPNQGADQH
jgi:hypothetical protein